MPPSFFRRYQSANPNLHDSLGCPVMCRKRSRSKPKRQKTKDKRQKTKDKRQKTKDKIKTIFGFLV
ncbi:hypothetical protein EYY85_00940 [Hafnia paralvei]|nr:hypothetical protein EYY85_00940 [Hafnia paralvei]